MTVLCVDDLVETHEGLVETDDIVDDFLVDFVRVFELAEIDTLGGAYDLDFGGAAEVSLVFGVWCWLLTCCCRYLLGQDVVKGDDHASGNVEELAVDLEHLGCGSQILLEAMCGCAKQHQGAAHADDVLLALEDVGNMDLDARVLVLLCLPDLGKHAAAGCALVVWADGVFLVVGVCELGRGADERGQRLLRLVAPLHVVVPFLARGRGGARRGARPCAYRGGGAGLGRRVVEEGHGGLVGLQQLVEDAALAAARDRVVLVLVGLGQRGRVEPVAVAVGVGTGTPGVVGVEQLFGVCRVLVVAAVAALCPADATVAATATASSGALWGRRNLGR